MSEFDDKIFKRDNDRRADAKFLREQFENIQPQLYRLAQSEGWESPLRQTVKEATDMIAKRNEARRLGHTPSNPPVTHHGAALENIRTDGNQDWLVIRQEDIGRWRKWLGIEAKAEGVAA